MYILDSSFFLSGIAFPRGELLTVPEVVEEVKATRKELLFAMAKGLRVLSPSKEALRRVKEIARTTGDDARISEADARLLALSLETGGIILTDDYSIQNTAESLGLSYRPVLQRGIARVEKWYYRCSYCGRYLSEFQSQCPVCGGPVKTTRRAPKERKKEVGKRRGR